MVKNIVSHKYCIFCFNYVISMLWEIFWGALNVCRSKIGDVENSSKSVTFFSLFNHATQETDQELKWKLSICLEKLSFGIFRVPQLRYQGGIGFKKVLDQRQLRKIVKADCVPCTVLILISEILLANSDSSVGRK